MHSSARIILLFIVCAGLSPRSSFAGIFDPVYNAKSGDRCQLAKNLYAESRKNETFTLADAKALKKFALDKSDNCLLLSSMIFLAEFQDRSGNKSKNEDSLLFLFKEALQFADDKGFEIEEAELTHAVGMKYYFMKQFPQAFEYLLKSYDKFGTVGFNKFPKMQMYLYNIGKVYYEFADYTKALPYLTQSLDFPFANSRATIHTYNTLGLTYNMLKNNDTATFYYKKGLEVAKSSKDSVWVGMLSGNMASIFLRAGQPDSAKPLILMDYRLSLRFGEASSAANCLLLLSNINMDEDSLSAATKRIAEVEVLMGPLKVKALMRDYFRTKARLASLTGDFKNAYQLQDSFILYKDRISAENNQNLIRNTEIKVQTEEYLSEIQLLEKDKKQDRIIRNFLLVAAGFIVIIAYLIFHNQRQKRKRDNAMLSLEKKQAEEELKNAENALQWYMNSLLEKNRLIDRFKEETEELKKKSVTVLSPENEAIMEKLYDSTILTEEDWTNFKRMFEKVHGDFFVRLKNKYPDLTLAEIRLLALTKLNLSINEIANMLGISPDSVRKTGSRMRKKLNLPTQTDLSDIASEI